QVGAPDFDDGVLDGGFDPHSRGRGKICGTGYVEVAGAGSADNGGGSGGLAGGCGRRRQRQDVIFGVVPYRVDPGDGGLAFGQGDGYIEQYRVHGTHRFKGPANIEQHPATGRTFGGNGDHQRNGEAQGVRTGNDQHGDGAYYGGVGHAQHGPHQRGQHRSP